MALPTVTARDLHTVQLDPKLRKLLHRRAVRANRREYAPVLAADRGAFGEANRNFRTEAAGVRGATNQLNSALAQALAGLKGSGLTGGYLKQAQNELTSRMGSATSAVPFLLADARENRTEGLSAARQQLRGDRASMLQSTAADFNSYLDSARSAGAQSLKEKEGRLRSKREEEQEPGEGKFDQTALENAKLELKNALSEWAKNPVVKVTLPDGTEEEKRLKEVNPLRTQEDWAVFAKGLADSTSGFGQAELNHIIQELLTNRKQKEHRGRLPQPGVPGYGTGLG